MTWWVRLWRLLADCAPSFVLGALLAACDVSWLGWVGWLAAFVVAMVLHDLEVKRQRTEECEEQAVELALSWGQEQRRKALRDIAEGVARTRKARGL